ncbi:MAG TPA: hypothetical protein IAB89_04660, partial [Candidatus Caccousia avicola]|nr:hypothetical protein [Candidatus Caccousia avicola]
MQTISPHFYHNIPCSQPGSGVYWFHTNIYEVIPLDFWQNIGPFLLAVVAVIINGVPQLLYAQARGFAL